MTRKPILPVSATHRTQHSLFYSSLFSASLSPYVPTSYSFSLSFVIYSSDLFLGQSSRALRGQKSLFPEYQWVTVGHHPALPTTEHLLLHPIKNWGCSEQLRGWELLQPLPQGWAVLNFQPFSM